MTSPVKTVIVPAREGLKVRKPEAEGGGYLDPAGEAVAWSLYWERHLRAGDVVIKPQPKSTSRKPKAEE